MTDRLQIFVVTYSGELPLVLRKSCPYAVFRTYNFNDIAKPPLFSSAIRQHQVLVTEHNDWGSNLAEDVRRYDKKMPIILVHGIPGEPSPFRKLGALQKTRISPLPWTSLFERFPVVLGRVAGHELSFNKRLVAGDPGFLKALRIQCDEVSGDSNAIARDAPPEEFDKKLTGRDKRFLRRLRIPYGQASV